jgi:hypothetical protein
MRLVDGNDLKTLRKVGRWCSASDQAGRVLTAEDNVVWPELRGRWRRSDDD